MSRSEFNTWLEEARANTHPVHVRCTGNQQQEPIQNTHDEAILEGFTHRVLIRTVEHCIRFGVKGQRPAAWHSLLRGLCGPSGHLLFLKGKKAKERDAKLCLHWKHRKPAV